MAVVDASVALAWALPDEGQELADGVLDLHEQGRLDLAAPTLWEYEVANALSRAVVQGRIAAAEGETSLHMLLGLEVERAGFGGLAARAWELSLARAITVYDASYVALAEARGCELYTCDQGLATAAGDCVVVHLVRAR